MIKKLSCILVIAILLCGCTFAKADILPFVVNVDCPDHFVEIDEPLGEYEYRYFTVDYHKCYSIYWGICYTCGSVERVGMFEGMYAHEWIYEDGGHVGVSLKHRRTKLCPVCGYAIVEQYNCPGPANGGCVIILGVGNIQETE